MGPIIDWGTNAIISSWPSIPEDSSRYISTNKPLSTNYYPINAGSISWWSLEKSWRYLILFTVKSHFVMVIFHESKHFSVVIPIVILIVIHDYWLNRLKFWWDIYIMGIHNGFISHYIPMIDYLNYYPKLSTIYELLKSKSQLFVTINYIPIIIWLNLNYYTPWQREWSLMDIDPNYPNDCNMISLW